MNGLEPVPYLGGSHLQRTAAEVMPSGTIIRSTGKWVEVRVGSKIIPCRIRGRMRLQLETVTQPVAVGDEVEIALETDGAGSITAVHPRRNALTRRAAGRQVGKEQILAANLDAIWIIQSVKLPPPNPGLIDRILVSAESQEIPAGIVFNKLDLSSGPELDRVYKLAARYKNLGYPVLLTSAHVGEGVSRFGEALTGHTSMLTGPSGVGKSSLLNAINPELELGTSDVSLKTRKGRHTTAHAVMLELPHNGFVIDTPGIREFGIRNTEAWELGHRFPEFRRYIPQCRFDACTHDHEPACAVKLACERKRIAQARYDSYLSILSSIKLGNSDTGR